MYHLQSNRNNALTVNGIFKLVEAEKSDPIKIKL